FRQVVEDQPNSAAGHQFYGLFLFAMGRWSEGTEQMQLALDLDPLSPEIASMAAYGRLTRDPQSTIKPLLQAIEMEPQYWYARVTLARAYTQVGRFEEAVAAAKAAEQIYDEDEVLGVLGWALGRAGRPEEAMKTLDELLERSRHEYVSPYFI